jgi:hypothetical protein
VINEVIRKSIIIQDERKEEAPEEVPEDSPEDVTKERR